MEPEKEAGLNKRYRELAAHQVETSRLLSNMNALLTETERFNVLTLEDQLFELLTQAARKKAIETVLEQYADTNVDIDVEGICEKLDKVSKGYFDVKEVKILFGTYWGASKDLVKKELFRGEVSYLMPWKADTVDQFVKNRCLVLRHQVTESKWGTSPDGMWQFRHRVENLEMLIRIHVQNADPRTVKGGLLAGLYRDDKINPWDKHTFAHDPVFLSTKLYKNGKFELELASGETARNAAAFLMELDREAKDAVNGRR